MELGNRNARISLSPRCNFNCGYCDGGNNRTDENPGAMEDFRSKPLDCGVISNNVYFEIIKILHSIGFGGIALTGGEPMLNNNWDKIVNYAKEIGIQRTTLTTNGMLLKRYIEINGSFPTNLSLLNISFDTFDKEKFKSISGGIGNIDTVIEGISLVKETNPNLPIRVNKVGLKSFSDDLGYYISCCENLGTINEINLLSLIRKSEKDNTLFKNEYISAQDIIKVLSKDLGLKFVIDNKYEYRAYTKKGLLVVVKDTNLTMRTKECDDCPIYCQEGFYTLRVATDGTIMTCPDYTAKLSPTGIIDTTAEISDIQILTNKIKSMCKFLIDAEKRETLELFINLHNLK